MLSANKEGVDKTADVLDTLLSVRSQLKELKQQLDGLS
jgi:predicted component of type VI protein secretion system